MSQMTLFSCAQSVRRRAQQRHIGTVQMMFDAVTTMTALAKGGQGSRARYDRPKRSELTPDLRQLPKPFRI